MTYADKYGFVPIWNYIVLKPTDEAQRIREGFVPIWNYIVLKHHFLRLQQQHLFCTHMELHCSKTFNCVVLLCVRFCTHMELHCSKTNLRQ